MFTSLQKTIFEKKPEQNVVILVLKFHSKNPPLALKNHRTQNNIFCSLESLILRPLTDHLFTKTSIIRSKFKSLQHIAPTELRLSVNNGQGGSLQTV